MSGGRELAEAFKKQRVVMNGLFDSSYVDWVAGTNGEAYRIFVGGPTLPFLGTENRSPDSRLPIVYVLDAKLNFAAVHAQVQMLSAMRQLPPAYVVGIGYAGDAPFFELDAFRRQGDLTPNEGGIQEAEVKTMNRADGIVHGGASAFFRFLVEELQPSLEVLFPVDRSDATLLGNSLGALFPSWVLFHDPGAFKRYVMVSPSWWWNDYEIWRWEEDWARNHNNLEAVAFACFGGLETSDEHKKIALHALQLASGDARAALEATIARSDNDGWMQGAELIPRFRATLEAREYPGLRLNTTVMPGETHESIPFCGFSRGLRSVFGQWSDQA